MISISGPEQINIRGAGVAGNGALVNTGVAQQNALQRVALLENATVGGTARFDIRAGDAVLDLAGFTLTKTGPNQFTLVNATVTDGDIVVNQGIFAIEAASVVEDLGPENRSPTTAAPRRNFSEQRHSDAADGFQRQRNSSRAMLAMVLPPSVPIWR
jgi:hypothetical protein